MKPRTRPYSFGTISRLRCSALGCGNPTPTAYRVRWFQKLGGQAGVLAAAIESVYDRNAANEFDGPRPPIARDWRHPVAGCRVAYEGAPGVDLDILASNSRDAARRASKVVERAIREGLTDYLRKNAGF